MGQGVDVEEPYHAVSGADPRDVDDDEAPVLGHAPPASRHRCLDDVWLILYSVLFTFPVIAITTYMVYANAPSFSVRLAGYEGIDPARPGRVVSPAFNLTLRMNKTCADRADVVVTYSGVALGWARVEPRDCTGERPGRDVEVVARGGGVGLSRRLRERMASEWRSGTVELDVDVVVYNDGPDRFFGGGDVRDKVMLCKLRTNHQLPSESSPCTWYSLQPYRY